MLSSKSLKKLALTAVFVGSTSVIARVVSAQSLFYYPSASFFSPQASIFESEDLLKLPKVLELGQFTTFIDSLQTAELSDLLEQKDTLTVLAPTEEAFAALSPEIKEKLSDPETLEKVLKYHLIVGNIEEDDIQRRKVSTMLEQNTVAIGGVKGESKEDVTVMLNDATASEPIEAQNGLVIPIDKVLIPADL